MSILFFEGFNLFNTDSSPYLDPNYWSRPLEDAPSIGLFPDPIYDAFNRKDSEVTTYGTYYSLSLSGYRLDTIPPQYPAPLQLSGVSGLNSNELYISFRVAGLGHSYTYGSTSQFPHTTKFLTLCSGSQELLSFDVVKTSGSSVQYGTWPQSNGYGVGISVKQTGINGMKQIGLFDLRVDGINNYYVYDLNNGSYEPLIVSSVNQNNYPFTRYVHLEFFLNKQTNSIRMKVEGFDVLNRAGRQPLGPTATGTPLGFFDNIKFYNKGVYGSSAYSNVYANYGNITLDDLAICNNSGNPPNTWMGPNTRVLHLSQAVESTPPISDWNVTSSVFGQPAYQALNKNDGDNSFVSSDNPGDIYSNTLTFDQQGNAFSNYFSDTDSIGAIRIFDSVRKTFLDSDFTNVYGVGDPTDPNSYLPIGDSYTIDNSNYTIKNSIISKDPSTDTPWTTGTFFTYDESKGFVKTSGYFGIKKL